MRAIGNIILSTANFDGDAALLVDGVAVPVRVRRSARARAYRLSLDAARGELRLSLPAHFIILARERSHKLDQHLS